MKLRMDDIAYDVLLLWHFGDDLQPLKISDAYGCIEQAIWEGPFKWMPVWERICPCALHSFENRLNRITQLAGAIEYTKWISAEG